MDTQLLRQKAAKTGGIQRSSHAGNLVRGKTRRLNHHPNHSIQGIRDHDNEGTGTMCFYFLPNIPNDASVFGQQILPAHSWPTSQTSRHNQHVTLLKILLSVRAFNVQFFVFDFGNLRNIQRFSLSQAGRVSE